MNKRRFVVVLALALVMALSFSLLVGCKKPEVGGMSEAEKELFEPGELKDTDLDAFELLTNAYANWIDDSSSYKRVQHFSFVAKTPLKDITSDSYDVYKKNGTKVYRELVCVQDSKPFKGNKNEVTRFYFNGNSAVYGTVNDKKVVPGKGDGDAKFEMKSRPSMSAFDGDLNEELRKYTKHLTTYVWDKRENLVDNGFKVKRDVKGYLHFTIEIDCSDEMMNSAHTAARDEFLSATGAAAGTLKMRENTTIDFVVEQFAEGQYRFLGWKRTESYQGKAMDFVDIPADQVSIETFSYDEADYTITDEDIA